MYQKIVNKIKEYQTIIIHRHSRPDGDALGSQIGLKEALKATFPDKQVYITGDLNGRYGFIGSMDSVKDDYYKNALVIVVDTASPNLISDERYRQGKYLIKMDHHTSGMEFGDLNFVDTNHISCSGLIAEMIFSLNWKLSDYGAQALFTGLVTDSGRFRYSGVTRDTFLIAAKLLEYDFATEEIYGNLYSEDIEVVRLRAQMTLNMKLTPHNVAYIQTTWKEVQAYNVDIFTISRGMVSIMSGIKNVNIWANFTEDADGKVLVELRSNRYNINNIAVKYDGGGHKLASGATLNSINDVQKILKDLDQIILEGKNE